VFTGIFVTGPGLFTERGRLLRATENGRAELLADCMFQYDLQYQALFGAGQFLMVLRQTQHLSGKARRVLEVLDMMDAAAAQERDEAHEHFVEDPQAIEFEGVDIHTPAGVCLVKDLSFRLEEGDSLLLCGHNGS
jgi:ABC-type uncharacterized transport system fused permease/ATPase subunit